ncbi:MAG: DUF1631 domain-containing protein [Spongiibacteraceae bacterium]
MADNTIKVVQLTSHTSKQAKEVSDLHMFARLPAPFMEMKEKGKQGLQPLLQALFDNIDDALFELADRAEHNAEQNMYFESMRELRIKRRGIELNFGKALDDAFLQLLTSADTPPTLGGAEEVSVDNLSLVGNDELEELVAADNMIAKAERQHPLSLQKLTVRLDSLFEQRAVTSKTNPYGPTVICYSFISVCKELDLDIKAKLVLFKLFDRYVMQALDGVYQLCNDTLVAGGILPKLGQRVTDEKSAAQPEQAPQQGHAAGYDAASVFADLQNLLHQMPQPEQQAASGLVAPGRAPQIPRATLMQLLQAVQQSLAPQVELQQQQALQGARPQQLDVQQALSDLLSAKLPSKPMSMGQVDDDAINLVAMLFQFILDDRNLAPLMKAQIARLQIPIIKVAMLDKSFFSKGGHPARKLLNEIANASLGWVPSGNIDRDPLYNKVCAIVSQISHDFDGDGSIFHQVLADFVAFLDVDKRRIGLVEQRTINAEDGKAKSELARTAVQSALNERVAGKALPKVVITLLEQAWSNVLFLICLKDGEQDKNWHDALQVVDDLLWSVGPMTSPESRQQLLAMVPRLLQNLRAGLTKIGYNPFDMNQLFEELENLHLMQLKALNTVKLNVSEQQDKPGYSSPSVAVKAQAIEKTLDQAIDEGGDAEISLARLDAELDEQLAEFDALEDLAEQAVAPVDAEGVVATPTPSSEPENGAIERQVVDKLVVAGAVDASDDVGADLAENDPCVQQVDELSMGCWVELHQDDGKKFRCRLAAIIRCSGKYIFVNRSGVKVAEYHRMALAWAIKQGQVSTLDDGKLFDRALESVIGNLRSMKAGN